jgi:hypothetical protein
MCTSPITKGDGKGLELAAADAPRGSGPLRSARVLDGAVIVGCMLLTGCHEGSYRQAEGFLQASGFVNPSAGMTDAGYREHDDRACDGKATLYAFVADNGAGLVCAEDGKVWFVAGGSPKAPREGVGEAEVRTTPNPQEPNP